MNTTEKVISSSDREMASAGVIELPVQERITKTTDEDFKEVKEDPDKKKQPSNDAQPAGADAADDKPAEIADIEDEVLLAHINKKRGTSYKSLDEINKPAEQITPPTPEEQELTKEKKSQDALKFGLEKKLFTKKDYESFITFNNTPKEEVVMKAFGERLRKDEPTLTDEEVEERFKDLYHQYDDDSSFKYKQGQEQIDALYEGLRNKQFAAIIKVEDVFDGVQKNVANAKIFKEGVETTIKNIEPKLTFKIDGEEIKANLFTPDQADKIKSNYLTNEMMAALLSEDGKINAEALTEEIKKDFIYDNLNAIVTEAAKSLADIKVVAYRKSRKAANFTEDANESDVPNNQGQKSSSDTELDEAKKKGII